MTFGYSFVNTAQPERCRTASAMTNPDNDPLWYDRAEPDEEPGPVIWLLAAVFVCTRAILCMPGFVYEIWLSKWTQARRVG